MGLFVFTPKVHEPSFVAGPVQAETGAVGKTVVASREGTVMAAEPRPAVGRSEAKREILRIPGNQSLLTGRAGFLAWWKCCSLQID